MKNIFYVLSVFLLQISCSTSNLRVESQPDGADVYVSVNAQTAKKIGVTPLNIQENQISSGNEPFQLSIIKEGFVTEHILSPATTFSRNLSVQVKLRETSSSKQSINDEVLQKVSSQVAYTQSLIRSKDYDAAERAILGILPQFPNVATFHELLGNVYYLKKDLQRAHTSYKRALDLNPSNTDTVRMIQRIEGVRSDLRSPSSFGGR
ncbi:MAG: tetratricopeptide repeat protein [Bdellovibrionaceae bacterium]|nr:tetratricopeptide repeat protein [Pseudobdellovibrionaceae bacterium]